MHTYHRLAVEAMDEDDAKGRALQFAENQEWSDWHSLMETDHLDFAVVTNYKANPEKFNELVEEALGWTQKTIDQAVKEYGDIPLKELLTNPQYDFAGYEGEPSPELTQEQKDKRLTDSLAVFRVGRALSVKNSEYGADIHFYDTQEYPPNPKYLQDRCVTNPEEQWIVIVDFHF